MRRSIAGWLLLIFSCGCLPSMGAGPQNESQPASAKDDPVAAQSLEYLLSRQRAYRIALEGSATPFQLQEIPIFRWQNNISGADGAVFVWLSADRPVLLAKTHINEVKSIYVESMSPLIGDKFLMTENGKTAWAPQEPAITRVTISDAAAPAEGKPGRLAQMRAIARQYRFTSLWGEENPSDWELRLLPTPLYRYASEDARVIDGAIFGYAQGTNPEAVVVVEAVATTDGPVWQAAPSRLTGYPVKAWHNDRQVLDVPRATHTPVNSPYRHFYQRLSPFPVPKAAN